LLIFLLAGNKLFSQIKNTPAQDESFQLLDSLWENPTSFFNLNDSNWRALCRNLDHIDLDHLNSVSHSIFYGQDAKILNHTNASDGALGAMNKSAHKKKAKKFSKKIRNGFRNYKKYPNHKLVLMEGDSWFEYPFFLKDITDNLIENEDLAIYSMASGGDWVSNMISTHQYQFEYQKLKPDVFIISGGGNDILGDNRLASFVNYEPIDAGAEFLDNYRNYVILRYNSKPVPMCNASYCPLEYHDYEDIMPELYDRMDSLTLEQIVNGRRYLNKSYYRWLVTLKLEYKMLLESIKKIDEEKFKSLMIITQGYDYAIPSFKERFGKSMFVKNGKWIKEPLMMKGIIDEQTQKDITMTMIFDFNEMIIELGKEFDNIYHIDSRGFTDYLETKDHKKKGSYWYDELHPKSKVFKEISNAYEALILNKFKTHHKVVNVIEYSKLGTAY
jgi:hypothetical protein